MDPLRLIRSDFDQLEAYTPVKPLDVLAREIGIPVERLVKLDANENLHGPAAEVIEAVAACGLNIYPDPSQSALRAAIAEYVGAGEDQVVAGSGADDLIDILIRLVMPRKVAIATPTFGMYSFLAKIARAEPIEVPRRPNFDLDVVAIRRAVHDGAGIVFLTSPNNPTGNSLSRTELDALASLDAIIVVDEAYVEFDGESVIPLIAAHPNLVVLRTFSKWAGLAGLRVGYSVSDARIASRMMAIKQPYNVNVAGEAAALAALKHRGTILETVRCIVAERDRMTTMVSSLGWLRPVPSQANFVLFAVEGRSAKGVVAALRKKGVLVRYYDRPDLANYIRISAGRPEDTDRLLEELRALEDA